MTSTAGRTDTAGARASNRLHSPPGTVPPARFRPRFHYELLTCGLRGHRLLGTDAAVLRSEDAGFDPAIVVRDVAEADGDGTVRWHRCLRCDSWVPLDPPDAPTQPQLPTRAEVDLPLRGRALRDRFVLRLIAIDRVIHFVGLALVAAAVFVFLADREALRTPFFAVLGTLRDTVGIGDGDDGVVGEVTRAFSASATSIVLVGVVVAAYALLEGVEAVGLWQARRWAEYLTLVATSVLLIPEVWELTGRVTVFKILALVINLAVIAYLLVAKRLFGLRGGGAAEEAARAEDQGWDALVRTAPGADGGDRRQGSRASR
ncbi:DUF2127 domain-containing protein [Actinomycetospora sp. TBRC 11914]|uniref:DUF2127 domain-containing protein n=1 Tax=Actinomycetospora sp. TBRC 11914 TaxID=2729387 RepID=UPI00145E58DA|nr:DUF2127 domain-containing protein [Actinomycetospora sp. TBRC 11914]NMO94128.1 DUF2127 domain-containing protein [Actinomycetospora sp. TBRC 11914]